ncbi:hypothetical protein [Sodalis glossinidius]|uniref:hypothetical protein n=1 Tax=Sodalis glossinidius TaxID=63612 RepID=UPI001FB1160B|nr:hypothetical protein [Sodalis glossinidius]
MFITGTADNYIRAFDVTSGKPLWQGRLPAGGQSTPMTYEVNGKQYVVTAAGGTRFVRHQVGRLHHCLRAAR